MRIVLLVEGDTEQRVLPKFLSRWFDGKLGKEVRIKAEKVKGIYKLARKAQCYFSAPRSDDLIAVFGIYDLYGFDEIPRDGKSRDEFLDFASKGISKEVGNPRFRMHFAVHELEAWLFSQPDIFPQPVRADLTACARSNPESIDFDNPPSYVLKDIWRRKREKAYRKTTDGINLFLRLDPQVAHDKCPHLARMLDEMLAMAKEHINSGQC